MSMISGIVQTDEKGDLFGFLAVLTKYKMP